MDERYQDQGREVPPAEDGAVRAMTLRLPVELDEWLRRDAFESRRSKNAIVVEALKRLREAG